MNPGSHRKQHSGCGEREGKWEGKAGHKDNGKGEQEMENGEEETGVLTDASSARTTGISRTKLN